MLFALLVPQDPGQCRNISCTNLLSKVLEGYILERARLEVEPKINQYGGEKNAGATHLLIEVLDRVAAGLEDNRAAVVLSAIDFSKAFNRLDHFICLKTFVDRGASNQVVNLLGAFLRGRRMTVSWD